MSAPQWAKEWERDCIKWRGRILTGEYSHWCYDWDGLPVDETTPEWPCNCFNSWDGPLHPDDEK